MSFRSGILLLTILILFSACEAEDFTPSSDNTVEMVEGQANELSQLLDLVNDLRQKGCKCGSNQMPPVSRLSWNNDLEDAALRHAHDMKTRNFFDHTGSDGSDISSRVTATGYNWQTVGENIAWGYRDISAVFQGWKDSPGHCRNMMNKHFQHMGTARVDDYWVQAFARPRAD